MLNFFQTLPDFNPVSAGSRASVKVPTGPTYREFVVKYTPDGTPANKATMIADLPELSIKINGTARFTISAAHLIMLNEFYGYGFTDGELVIPLSRPWARTIEGEENLAWGTRNISNMYLDIKIAAGATNPQLSADAAITPESRDLGLIVEVHNYPYEAISAGKKEIPDLPKENGSLLALHLESAVITALEVKMNKVPFIENDADLNAYQRYLKRVGKRVPQNGFIHVDPMALNRIDDSWPLRGLQEFRVNPTVSGAGSIPIIMETLSQPLGAATPAS